MIAIDIKNNVCGHLLHELIAVGSYYLLNNNREREKKNERIMRNMKPVLPKKSVVIVMMSEN